MTRPFVLRVAFGIALAALASIGRPPLAKGDPRGPASPEAFKKSVQPYLDLYCFDCHAGRNPYGSLRLDEHESLEAIQADRETWLRVFRMVRGREMPPPNAEAPPPEETQEFLDWLDAALNWVDCSGPRNPGRVTLRRLNRTEYQNTIRDLLGVNYQATEEFPADEVGYGFDNIGDVLSLPPLLMEKYLAAAETIAAQAIVAHPSEAVARRRIEAPQLQGPGAASQGRRVLSTNGTLTAEVTLDAAGEYLIAVRAYGDQAGDEPARMRLHVGGDAVETFDVTAEREAPQLYEHRREFPAGRHRIGVEFTNDYYEPSAPENRRDRNLAVLFVEVAGPLAVRWEDYPAAHRAIFFVRPGEGLSEAEAARQILGRLASRAFRRTATEAEVGRLAALAAAAGKEEGFEYGIQTALTAILVSPQFLFRVERDPEPGAKEKENVRELDEFELAARMSYFLWSSMPDEELFQLAAEGKLRANLESQVRRMIQDEKSRAFVESFAVQWLQLRGLEDATPDRRMFPAFSNDLRAAMLMESKQFFEYVMRADRSILELIDADYTFVNEPLARLYGITGVSGEALRQVSLRGTARGGVLTQASVLTVTSNPTRTSPVKRGKWILENILGEPPPEPPPGVPDLPEDRQSIASGSLRERLEQHRADPNCAVCHRKMDAMGFAFENFDAIGGWREKDGRFDIDPAGELPDGQRFSGPVELKRILLTTGRDDFVRCLTEKMLIYALGRGLEPYDRCAVLDVVKAVEEDDYRFSRMVVEIVRSDPFQKRSGK